MAGWAKLVKDPTKNWDTIESLVRYAIDNAYSASSYMNSDGDIITTYWCQIGDETIQVTVNESKGIISDAYVLTK